MTILKLLSVHVNEKDSIQACGVFIRLESEKHKLHVSDTGSTWWYTWVVCSWGRGDWTALICRSHSDSRVPEATLFRLQVKKKFWKKLRHQPVYDQAKVALKHFILKKLPVWRFHCSGIWRNVGNCSPHTASHPKNTVSSATPLWAPPISQLSISHLTGGFLTADNDFNCKTVSVFDRGQSSGL
jgi:hypothetical protein